jgi:hypothetical protein
MRPLERPLPVLRPVCGLSSLRFWRTSGGIDPLDRDHLSAVAVIPPQTPHAAVQ